MPLTKELIFFIGLTSFCCAFINCAVSGSDSNILGLSQGKLFLIGGGTSDSTSSIYNALRESTGKARPSIAVVISAAPTLADGLDAYYVPDSSSTSYEILFTDYGFIPSVVRLAQDNYQVARTTETQLGRENIVLIQNADVVFFNGGDQSRHSRSWLNDDGTDSQIMTILRARFLVGSIVIAGTSAGLAVQANPTFGEGISYGYFKYNADLKPAVIGETFRDDRDGNNSERYDINGGYMTGFGFLENALLDSHFDARGRFVRLAAVMKNVGKSYGFGVEEDTALYVNYNNATVFGNGGVWLIDTANSTYPIGDHFLADYLIVSYLTEGDHLDWDVNENGNIDIKIHSSKELITSTNGTVYSSKNIFARQEGIKSMTSLVISNSLYTIGESSDKRPICRVIFHKQSQTKGYRSTNGEKYTIDRMYMDVESI